MRPADVPSKTIWPPSWPAPGPRSMIRELSSPPPSPAPGAGYSISECWLEPGTDGPDLHSHET